MLDCIDSNPLSFRRLLCGKNYVTAQCKTIKKMNLLKAFKNIVWNWLVPLLIVMSPICIKKEHLFSFSLVISCYHSNGTSRICIKHLQFEKERTSEDGNGNHIVWLPIILIKNKVNQMLLSSYIRSLLISILRFCI